MHSFVYNRVNFLFQKRKFDRYIYDGIITTIFGVKYGSENVRDQGQKSLFLHGTKEFVFPTLDDEREYCGIFMKDCSYLNDPNSIKGSSYPMKQRSKKVQARDEKFISQVAKEQIFPTLNNKVEYCATCMEDYSHLSESEDFIKVPRYPLYQGSLKIQHRDLMVSDSFSLGTIPSLNHKQKIDFVETLNSMDDRDLTNGETSLPLSSTVEDMKLIQSLNNKQSLNDEPKIDLVEALKLVDDRYVTDGKTSLLLSSTMEDMEIVRSLNNKSSLNDKPKIDFVGATKSVDDKYFTDGKTSLSLSSTVEDMDLVRSLNNFLPARGNHLPRPIIPNGPRFQAKIPKWEGGTNIKLGNDDDGLKWYGTQIWPIPFISETNI